ncbi:MAG: helix-turn-helix domain-containing protein [Hymenobacter sp.]
MPRQFGFLAANAVRVLPLPTAQVAQLWQLMQEAKQVLAGASPRKSALMRSYLGVVLNTLADYCEGCDAGAAPPAPPLDLVSCFQQLVTAECRCQRRVGEYASQLCVTPKHLSETMKRTTGQWLDGRLLLEAKIWLRQNQVSSVSQIAEELHFSDVSAFVKFFRRQHAADSRANRRRQQ